MRVHRSSHGRPGFLDCRGLVHDQPDSRRGPLSRCHRTARFAVRRRPFLLSRALDRLCVVQHWELVEGPSQFRCVVEQGELVYPSLPPDTMFQEQKVFRQRQGSVNRVQRFAKTRQRSQRESQLARRYRPRGQNWTHQKQSFSLGRSIPSPGWATQRYAPPASPHLGILFLNGFALYSYNSLQPSCYWTPQLKKAIRCGSPIATGKPHRP